MRDLKTEEYAKLVAEWKHWEHEAVYLSDKTDRAFAKRKMAEIEKRMDALRHE
jgi:hypothetical protein